MKTILIVEDEKKISDLVCKYLEVEGYQAITTDRGNKALELCKKTQIDLVVLDRMLPDSDGISICIHLRELSDLPIILLTARINEEDRLEGFTAGADDYICKPFSPRELVARIRAIFLREDRKLTPNFQYAGSIKLNTTQRIVTVRSKNIKLTRNEFNLLESFIAQPNRVFSRQELLTVIQGSHSDSYERTIDSHIKNLRKKILDIDTQSPYIESIYGVGYKLVVKSL